jgi:cytochrome c oxidase assembly factor CtaG
VTAEEVFFSWAFQPVPTAGLLGSALVYWLGWRRLHRQLPERFPPERLISFLLGLAAIFVALTSPLDAFAGWLLTVHMVQHLLLTMLAPPLILLGWPMLPMLGGLPRGVARNALGPFLTSPALHRVGRLLVHPYFAGPLFMVSNLAWHTPALYGLALRSPGWHQTEHLCFLTTALLFWWPVIQPWPSRAALPRWAMIPYLLAADLQNTALAAYLSFQGGVIYAAYAAAPRISGLSAVEDQAAAGAVMWVPGSMAFLIPAGVIALRMLSPRRATRAPAPRVPQSPPLPRRRFDLLRAPLVGPLMRWRHFRTAVQSVMLALAAAVVLDGLLGPQVGAMNLAGVLPWTHWRGATVVALLVAGNLFCMACPFMLVRDFGRKFFRPFLRWPRALRTKWLAVALFAAYFWAYEAFDLWNSPWWTAWIVIFYFSGTLLVDAVFKNASFCKFLCPIGQFHFVASLASPLEVRVREPATCAACRTRDCIRGNSSQRGCELLLYQPRKSGNMDCTFCLDCVNACPHDNVGIVAVPPGLDLIADPRRSSLGRFARRPDLAALVLVFVFAAFANAAGMIGPVGEWEAALHRVAGPAGGWIAWSAAFVCAVVALPLALAALCGKISAAAAPGQDPAGIASGFAAALAPLGFAMWIAHFAFHFFTGLWTPWPVIQRIARDAGAWAGVPDWNIPAPAFDGLTGLQILLLDAGLLLSLWILWKKSRATGPRAFRVFLPWAALALALYALGLWLFFQPMDMRGTMRP